MQFTTWDSTCSKVTTIMHACRKATLANLFTTWESTWCVQWTKLGEWDKGQQKLAIIMQAQRLKAEWTEGTLGYYHMGFNMCPMW